VHFVAALRLLLGSANEKLASLVSFTALLRPALPPVDTIQAIAKTEAGATGTITLSFGTEFKSGLEVEIVTTRGAVLWNPRLVTVTTKDKVTGEKVEESEEFGQDSGVKAEVAAWAASIARGEADVRQTPREALRDLEVVQRLLESGERGGVVVALEG